MKVTDVINVEKLMASVNAASRWNAILPGGSGRDFNDGHIAHEEGQEGQAPSLHCSLVAVREDMDGCDGKEQDDDDVYYPRGRRPKQVYFCFLSVSPLLCVCVCADLPLASPASLESCICAPLYLSDS